MGLNFNNLNAAEQIQLSTITTPLFADGAIVPSKLGQFASVIIQDITYTAVNGGAGGNAITVQYIEDGIASLETVSVTGTAIVVHIGNHTVLGSTATQVLAAVQLSQAASLLVGGVISGTPSNIQLAVSATHLAGGITGATGVSSIHADSHPNIAGAVQLVSGANITLSQSGNAITISNGETPITTGNLTEVTSAVLTITGGTNAIIGSGTTIDVKQASTSQSGYLSSTDWNTFNSKQPAGSYLTTTLASTEILVGNGSNIASPVTMTGDIHISNTGVTSIQSGVVTNSQINASAAIAYSKLALSGSIHATDIASGQVVKTINSLTDAVILAAGSNITITPSGQTLTIASTGGGGGSPAGSDTQIQYNASGSFGANAGFTFTPDIGAGSNLTLGGDNGTEIIFSNSDQSVNYGQISGQLNDTKQVAITVAPGQYIFTPQEFQVSAAGIELLTNAYVEFDDGGSNSVSISAPGTVNTTYDLFLPADQGGASTFLLNDGAGNLSWATIGGGNLPNIIQQIEDTADFFITLSPTFVDSGFGVTITPTTSSASILITFTFSIDPIGSGQGLYTLFRGIGGTNLGGSNNALAISPQNFESTPYMISITYVDLPGTTLPVTYELYVASPDGSTTIRLNDDGLRMVAIAQEIH